MRLDLGYDGASFVGWARQPDQRTVQGELEAALTTLLRAAAPPMTTVAGRTDAGVHARGQVCHVDVRADTWAALPGRTPASPAESLVHRLAGLLPPDIRVHVATVAPPGFDARFSALARRYVYRIYDAPAAADPLRRDVLVHRRRLDVAAMDTAGAPLVGKHDFAAFCKPRDGATTIRRVLSLRCTRETDQLVLVDIEADAFCYSMVRAVTGALVAVGEGRHDPAWPGEVLAAGVRDPAVQVLPPGGLTLEAVRYPPDDELAERATSTRRRRAGTAGQPDWQTGHQ